MEHTAMVNQSLAERRRALGLSQQEVAVAAGCSIARVGQIEREALDAPTTPVREAINRSLTELEAKRPRVWHGDSELPDEDQRDLPEAA